MAREISATKRLEVIGLYFEGLPYNEIAMNLGIAKGSVAAIIEELRDGIIPEFEHVADLANGMRELAVQFHKAAIAPTEAILLFTLVKRLINLGVESALLESWVKMCQSISEGDLPRSQIIQAATKLTKLEAEGLSYEEVITKLTSASAELKQVEEKVKALRSESRAIAF